MFTTRQPTPTTPPWPMTPWYGLTALSDHPDVRAARQAVEAAAADLLTLHQEQHALLVDDTLTGRARIAAEDRLVELRRASAIGAADLTTLQVAYAAAVARNEREFMAWYRGRGGSAVGSAGTIFRNRVQVQRWQDESA
jgi:hypothetical protein